MMLNNIEDMARHFGSDTEHLARDVYKYTDCGAWIRWNNESVQIGSIVEGSDAEFNRTFAFPVESGVIDAWFDELEQLTDEAWHEANDPCCRWCECGQCTISPEDSAPCGGSAEEMENCAYV